MIKNGKLFGKINVFDFALIIVLVLLVFGITAKIFISASNDAKKNKITYEINVKSVRQETVDSFEIGQMVYAVGTSNCLGKITNVTSEGATDLMETLDGRIIEAPVENRYNFTLTVETEALEDDKGILSVNRYKIIDGKDISFDTVFNRCQGTIQGIKRTEKN